MFESILNGLVGSSITALVALVAPYLAHRHAIEAVRRAPPNASLPPVAAFITQMFTAMEITSAKRFKLQSGEAYSDAHLDLIVGIELRAKSDKMFSGTDRILTLTLPTQSEPETIVNPLAGWSRIISFEGEKRRLTMVGSYPFIFELRTLTPAKDQDK